MLDNKQQELKDQDVILVPLEGGTPPSEYQTSTIELLEKIEQNTRYGNNQNYSFGVIIGIILIFILFYKFLANFF